MTWGIESNVIERFGARRNSDGENLLRARHLRVPFSGHADGRCGAFKNYYGPTMNAFDAAEKNGKAADLQKELEVLFTNQNQSSKPTVTTIPATFLRVTVSV